MPKYLSGRSKKNSSSNLPLDRYNYLSLGDAEPNPGDPRTTLGPSGTGEKSIIGNYSVPSSEPYVVVTYLDNPNGNAIRYWKPLSEGTIPGAVTVFDEGTQVGTSNSITKLNFIGLGITAIAAPWVDGVVPGNIATMTIAPPGDVGSVLFKETVWDPKGNSGVGTHRGDFNTSYKLQFDSTAGILTATSLNIGTAIAGIGGSIFNVTGVGNTALVGIGTTNPLYNLHVFGDVGISSGTIYDVNNFGGNNGDIILKNNDGYIEWKPRSQVVTSAGGTIGNIQFHDSLGFVEGASDWDVNTDSQTASNAFVWDSTNYRVGIGSTEPSAKFDVVGDSKFTGITTFVGFTTTTDLESQQLKVSGVSTFVGFSTFKDSVYIAGITTIGNIKIEGNKLYNDDGNLLLEAEGNYVQANDRLYVNNTTESTTTGDGALQIVGGAGIAKNVNVGGALSITGPADATGVAVTLAAAGGITTTGGDLYIGGDLFVNDDIFLDEARVQSLVVNPGVSTFHGQIHALDKVGIGTDNPETLLDVYGDGANGEITAQRKDGTSILIQAQASLGRFGTNSNDDLQLMSNSAGYLTIKTSGRVGIGTTIPNANLQVDYDEGNSQVGLRLRAYNATNSKTWQISEINGDAGTLQIRNATNSDSILNIDGTNSSVGIGTTTPGKKLDVVGSIRSTVKPWVYSANQYSATFTAREDATHTFELTVNQNDGSAEGKEILGTYAHGVNNSTVINAENGWNVGIGTTNPQADLDVRGEGRFLVDAFRYGTDSDVDEDRGIYFRRDFVGVSTYNLSIIAYDHTPGHKDGLSINAYDGVSFCTGSNTRQERLRISSDGSVSAGGNVLTESDIYWTTDTYQRAHIFSGATGGSPGDGVVVAASPFSDPTSQRIGAFAFGCKTSTSDAVTNAGLKAVIEGHVNSSPGNDWKAGSEMRFLTRPDNGDLTERLRIKSDGEIVFPAAGSDRLSMRHKNGGNFVIKNPSAANLSFGTDNDDDELTILNGGNVGIGSTIPDQKLVVNGNIEARGGNWFIARSGDNGNYSYIKNPESAGSALGFFTSGEKMRITSTGDVGIGTDNPIGVNALVDNNTTLAVGIVTANNFYGPIEGAIIPNGTIDIESYIRHKDNTTTKFGFPADNTFAIETNNSRRLTIDSDGGFYAQSGLTTFTTSNSDTYSGTQTDSIFTQFNVFNTNNTANGTSAGIKLASTNTGSQQAVFNIACVSQSANRKGDLIIQTRLPDDTYVERLRIDSSGSVGIGTIAPQQMLDVRGNTIIGIDQVSGNPGTTVGITTIRGHHVGSDSDYAQLYLSNSKSAGGGTPPTASIRAGRETNNYGTNLSFWTNSTSSAGDGSERLRINSSGNLEISTTTQDAHIGLIASSTAINLTLGSVSGTSPRMYFYGTGNGQDSAGDTFLATGTGGIQKFRSATKTTFEINADGGLKEALCIQTDGNIGIGTDNPGKKLDVTGSIRSTVRPWVYTSNQYSATFTSREDAGHTFELVVNQNDGSAEGKEILGSYYDASTALSSTNINAETGWNVGIGTTNPDSHLTVKKGSSTGISLIPANDTDDFQINFNRVGGSTRGFITYDFNDDQLKVRTGGSGEALRIYSTGNPLFQAPNTDSPFSVANYPGTMYVLDTTEPSEIGVGGRIVFGSKYYNGSNTMSGAYIGQYKEHAPSNGVDEYEHALTFGTRSDSNVMTEKLRITSAGNVGIGTDNPTGVNAVEGNEAVLAVGILTAGKIYGDVDVTGTIDKAKNLEIGATNKLIIQTGVNETDILAATDVTNYVLIGGANDAAPTWAEKAPKATLADDAIQIRTIKKDNQASAYLTFVDSNNSTNAYENLYTSTNIIVDSHPTTGGIKVTGIVTATTFDGAFSGNVTGNADTSTKVYVTDNESTDENNLIPFVADAGDASGNHALEMDGDLHYNPNTGKLTATLFDGNLASGESGDFPRLLYNSAANTTAFLAKGSNNTYLGLNDSGNLVWGTPAGTGISDLLVSYTGRTSPCSLPITVSGTTTKTINIPSSSNAFGAKYVQSNEPTGDSVCDGDIWYDTGASGSISGSTPVVITSNSQATSKDFVVVNGSGLTVTLPPTPSIGDYIELRILGTRYCSIARNGSKIESLEEDLYIDIMDGYVKLIYTSATLGWIIAS